MSPIFRNVTMAYLIFLSAVLGASLYAGIVVAPITFNTEAIFGSPVLSQFQEGMIMTQNFIKLSYMVTLSVIAVVIYEGYKYKMGERDILTSISFFLVVATGLMFSYYYLPDIILMQQAGEEMTKTQLFLDTHKGSEIDFKIYVFALLLLLIRNFKKALR
ncbi:MAG: DUF4149 domain-containing protein [Sulfurovaceae bacterium]|nr:DUF4149 domain-containing protein [Sulfurovaceae bacterium]